MAAEGAIRVAVGRAVAVRGGAGRPVRGRRSRRVAPPPGPLPARHRLPLPPGEAAPRPPRRALPVRPGPPAPVRDRRPRPLALEAGPRARRTGGAGRARPVLAGRRVRVAGRRTRAQVARVEPARTAPGPGVVGLRWCGRNLVARPVARVWASVVRPAGRWVRDEVWAPARRTAVEAGRAAREALASARATLREARADAWRALVGAARPVEPREPAAARARTLGSTTNVSGAVPAPEISLRKRGEPGGPPRRPVQLVDGARPCRPATRRRTTGQATARRPAARTGGAAHPTALHQARPPPVHQPP